MVDNSGCNEDSDIEEALGSKKDSDTEYKSAPEDTENTDVPHSDQELAVVSVLKLKNLQDDLYEKCKTNFHFYPATSHISLGLVERWMNQIYDYFGNLNMVELNIRLAEYIAKLNIA